MFRLHNCCNPVITKDGFCFKHKHYSMEEEYIIKHIKILLSYVNNATTCQKKVQKVIKLFNYLKYKKEFINNHPVFKKTVENKIIEINNHMKNRYSNKVDDKIKIKAYKTFEIYMLS